MKKEKKQAKKTTKKPKIETLTVKQLTKIEELAQYTSAQKIADYLKIGRSTFYNLLKREPRALEAYNQGKAKGIVDVAKTLYAKAMEGDVTAQIFIIKTQAAWGEDCNLMISKGKSAKEKAGVVTEAMLAGEITASHANKLLDIIKKEAEIAQATEFEQRLAALEQKAMEQDFD